MVKPLCTTYNRYKCLYFSNFYNFVKDPSIFFSDLVAAWGSKMFQVNTLWNHFRKQLATRVGCGLEPLDEVIWRFGLDTYQYADGTQFSLLLTSANLQKSWTGDWHWGCVGVGVNKLKVTNGWEYSMYWIGIALSFKKQAHNLRDLLNHALLLDGHS